MFAKSVIFFLYIACLIILCAGLTCLFLTRRKNKTEVNKALLIFNIGLAAVCLYDMGIYFWNYVIGHLSSMEILRIGNCLIALAIFLWITGLAEIMKRDSLKLLVKMVKNYILFYAAIWLVLTFATPVKLFYTMKWLLLSTDILLIVGALAVSTAYIVYAAVENEKLQVYFISIVSGLLLWNYISYFWGETSVYWGNSDFIREPLDLTIVFWLIIAAVFLVYVYKTEFFPTFLSKSAEKEEMIAVRGRTEDRIANVCSEYGLTPREREFIELIYKGKSNREIADQLFLSESTVKTHIYNIFKKMEVKSRVGVICIINEESPETVEKP